MPYKMTFDKDKLDNIIRTGGSNHLNEYAEEIGGIGERILNMNLVTYCMVVRTLLIAMQI
jgi:hypothetical protein